MGCAGQHGSFHARAAKAHTSLFAGRWSHQVRNLILHRELDFHGSCAVNSLYVIQGDVLQSVCFEAQSSVFVLSGNNTERTLARLKWVCRQGNDTKDVFWCGREHLCGIREKCSSLQGRTTKQTVQISGVASWSFGKHNFQHKWPDRVSNYVTSAIGD